MLTNTEPLQNQPLKFANKTVENSTPDPFTMVDGHYIGHDGFVVPKNFDEFHERFPEYVRNWVRTHVDRSTPKEDVEDWTQDLLIHMRYLPARSKHREAGKRDIVQTFDPHKHYGANAARFFNYINLCLGNKLRSIHSKRRQNPICRAGNVSLGGHFDESDSGQMGEEFCHAHSAHLRGRCQRQERQRDASHTLTKFVEFLRREDAGVIPVMGAIAATTTPTAAAELLGITKPEFRRFYSRLRNLGQFFLKPQMRRRRSATPKTHCADHCEIAAIHPSDSCTAWKRVELYNEVWDQPLVKLAKKYRISDVRVGKVCRRLRIPLPGRGYWAKRKAGKPVRQPPLTEFEDAPVVKRLNRNRSRKRQSRGLKVPTTAFA